MKKSIALLLAGLLMIGVFAGCAPADQTPSGNEGPQGGTPSGGEESLKAEITLWSMPLVSDMEVLLRDQLLPAFNKQYPDVKVNLEMLTWDGGPEKLQIALGTGSTPDLYLDGTARTASLPGKGVLAEVTDVIQAHPDLYPTLTEIGKLDGKNYLIPANGMMGIALTVNKTLAEKLGTYQLLPADKESWSFEEFYAFIKACTEAGKADGVYGTALWAGSQSSDFTTYSLMLSNGGGVLSADKKKCVAGDAASVGVIDVLGRIVNDGYAVPGAATLKDEETAALFFNQKTVIEMTNGPITNFTVVDQMKEDGQIPQDVELEIFGLPTSDGKTKMRTGSWGANTFAIFKNSGDESKLKAAKALVDVYYSQEEVALAICKLGRLLSAAAGTDHRL